MGDVEGYTDSFVEMLGVISRWNTFIAGPAQAARALFDKTLTVDDFESREERFLKVAVHVFECDSSIWDMKNKVIKGNKMEWSSSHGYIFKLNKEPVGCSFLYSILYGQKRYTLPIMYKDGALMQYYSHVIPALMINQLMPTLERIGTEVTTYVLCQGNGIQNAWWDRDHVGDEDVADRVIACLWRSDAFRLCGRCMTGGFRTGKKVKRLCIWIKDFGHVFMLVWETRVSDTTTSYCFAVDNLCENSFRDVLLDRFIYWLGLQYSPHTFSKLRKGVACLDGRHIGIEPDMLCVSFMTRSTLYLSMVNRADLVWTTKRLHGKAGIELERKHYIAFERCLLKFIETCMVLRNTVWLSPIHGQFVNINDVKLLSVNPAIAHIPRGRIPYVYAGATRGFVPESMICGDSEEGKVTCVINSRFLPLAHVRECRLALEEGLRRLE
jgi:hypothetical protein